MRMAPRMRGPVPTKHVPKAKEVAVPPEDPPGVFFRFQGLPVTPQPRLHVKPAQENADVAVRACKIAPSARMRSLMGAVLSAIVSICNQRPAGGRLPRDVAFILDRNGKAVETSRWL